MAKVKVVIILCFSLLAAQNRRLPLPDPLLPGPVSTPTPAVPASSYEVLLSLSPAPLTTDSTITGGSDYGDASVSNSESYKEKTDVAYIRRSKKKRRRRYSTDPDAENFFTKYTLPTAFGQPQTSATLSTFTPGTNPFSSATGQPTLTPAEAVQITAACVMIIGTYLPE